MDVWIAQWEYPNDMDSNISVFLTEKDALEDVLSDIEDHITNNWDMDDSDQSQWADDISALHQSGKLREAMDKWNEYQANYNDEYAEYYSVIKKEVQGGSSASVIPTRVATHSHASNGATCRGPCKQHNEYANPDRADGTYLCRQCSTFQTIFGVNQP